MFVAKRQICWTPHCPSDAVGGMIASKVWSRDCFEESNAYYSDITAFEPTSIASRNTARLFLGYSNRLF